MLPHSNTNISLRASRQDKVPGRRVNTIIRASIVKGLLVLHCNLFRSGVMQLH